MQIQLDDVQTLVGNVQAQLGGVKVQLNALQGQMNCLEHMITYSYVKHCRKCEPCLPLNHQRAAIASPSYEFGDVSSGEHPVPATDVK